MSEPQKPSRQKTDAVRGSEPTTLRGRQRAEIPLTVISGREGDIGAPCLAVLLRKS
jgi:hypothetical protein